MAVGRYTLYCYISELMTLAKDERVQIVTVLGECARGVISNISFLILLPNSAILYILTTS